jgi:hypothetical protein
MTGKSLLRRLIREEVGRGFMRGERVDFYPWRVDDTNVSVIYDAGSDKFWAFIEETPSGEFEKKSFPSEEEARHWARQVLDRKRRDDFSIS